jgi:hypothetical protein
LDNAVEAMTISVDDRLGIRQRPDGSRAIVAPPQIIVVQHFDEELKHLVPK